MDQPGLAVTEHVRALRGLGRINSVSRVGAVLWPPIERLARLPEMRGRSLRVLDLATGGGDTPIALARRAETKGLNVHIDGCDFSEQAICHSRQQAAARRVRVNFFVLDALTGRIPPGYDVVCCSLFLHHLDDTDAINLLRRMSGAAHRLVMVDDLIRNRWGYYLALVGCRLLSRSAIVHFDGPTSVAGAFTPSEALALAEQAGLQGARLTRHWPQRFLLTWSVQ